MSFTLRITQDPATNDQVGRCLYEQSFDDLDVHALVRSLNAPLKTLPEKPYVTGVGVVAPGFSDEKLRAAEAVAQQRSMGGAGSGQPDFITAALKDERAMQSSAPTTSPKLSFGIKCDEQCVTTVGGFYYLAQDGETMLLTLCLLGQVTQVIGRGSVHSRRILLSPEAPKNVPARVAGYDLVWPETVASQVYEKAHESITQR